MKPPSIRGGATGYSQKTTKASRLTSTSALRSGRYSAGAPPQPGEHAERDDEVRVVVVVGDHQPERVLRRQPGIEPFLGVEPDRAPRCSTERPVRQRDVRAQRREVEDDVVDPAQPGDREQLDPPARATAATAFAAGARPAARRRDGPTAAGVVVTAVDKNSMLSAATGANRARGGARLGRRRQAAGRERLDHARQRGRRAPPRVRRRVLVGVVQQQHRAGRGRAVTSCAIDSGVAVRLPVAPPLAPQQRAPAARVGERATRPRSARRRAGGTASAATPSRSSIVVLRAVDVGAHLAGPGAAGCGGGRSAARSRARRQVSPRRARGCAAPARRRGRTSRARRAVEHLEHRRRPLRCGPSSNVRRSRRRWPFVLDSEGVAKPRPRWASPGRT